MIAIDNVQFVPF